MSLILATGSNLGDRLQNLNNAKEELAKSFHFIAQSRVYKSEAIEYTQQPEFYNQVLEFKLPNQKPEKILEIISKLESKLGRRRDIPKGPRTIDIDIIFWELESFSSKDLIIPHPAWSERSFVTLPLAELPYFETIRKTFIIPKSFSNTAEPI